jgi:hypothetical protein
MYKNPGACPNQPNWPDNRSIILKNIELKSQKEECSNIEKKLTTTI